MIMQLFGYIATGITGGFLAGLLGIGGGAVVVPALAFLYPGIMPDDMIMHMAVGTSLAIMLFTSSASLRIHHQASNIDWRLFKNLAPTLMLGVILGALLAKKLSTQGLETFFGVFLMAMALRILFYQTPKSEMQLPNQVGMAFAGLGIGILSGILGVGGGVVAMPFLISRGVDMRTVVGVSTAISMTVALIGTFSMISTGFTHPNLPAWSTGYVYWPAVLVVGFFSMNCASWGAKVSQRVPVPLLRRFFAVFLALVGTTMVWR
jgi:uncharacterized membrane protein YfcA